MVFDNVQEGLVKVDRTGKMVPWLAERWYTTDSKNYTFFLRKGVRFHNGREMKAADVKFALDRAVNPETKHPYRTQYEAIQDVIVKDDYTVTVTLKKMDAIFLYTMARQGSVIYPREAVDTLKTQPIGHRPLHGGRVGARRPHRPHQEQGLLGEGAAQAGPGGRSGSSPIPTRPWPRSRPGDIDVSAFGLGPESVDELKKDARFQVIVGDTTNDVTLSMNNSKKPFSDQRVRLAITHAINKDEVLKGAMFGLGRVLGSNVDPTNPYFVDVSKRVPYDPAKAKKLLAEAGYPNGFEAVFKVAPQYYYTVRSAEVLVEPARQGGHPRQHPADRVGPVALAGLLPGALPEPRLRHVDHRPRRGLGHRQLREPEILLPLGQPAFQKLYQESQVTVDDKKRRELYVKMQEMLADEAPAVWLYMHPRLVVTKKGVTGIWKDLPLPVLDLSEVAWQK